MKKRFTSDVLKTNRFGKSAEREILDNFLKRLQIHSCQIKESEKPDFFVSLPAVNIGVEITQYHNDTKISGSLNRKRFEVWSQISKQLQNELKKHNLSRVYGSVSFKVTAYKEIWKIDQKKLIKDLIGICKTINIQSPNCFEYDEFPRNSYIHKVISGIHLDILQEGDNVLWWCSHLQSGPIADPIQVLPKIIKKKIQSGEKYDWQDADSGWLVIAALALGLSDTGIISRNENRLKLKQQDVFDYIYYWDKFSEEIWEIYPGFRIVFDTGNRAIYVSRFPSYLPSYRAK